MSEPVVSFIIPCYRLAHLLPECVNSILAQSYTQFEVLIMDDCSPDNTPEVARSFQDPRVKHIRNEPNLGHLRNYNKGIGLARGKYIWLISADDRLRSEQVLDRYVELFERMPSVGFVFCPAMALRDGRESGLVSWSWHGERDAVFKGHLFLERLRNSNCVAAPSVLARRQCYDRSLFPLDLPNTGDWFLWCIFSMHHDVAYFAEPMVCYRWHDQQMTNWFLTEQRTLHAENDLLLRWHVMKAARSAGFDSVAKDWAASVASFAALQIVASEDGRGDVLNYERIQAFLGVYGVDPGECNAMQALIAKLLGDIYLARGMTSKASENYLRAMRAGTPTTKLLVKLLLSLGGPVGFRVYEAFSSLLKNGHFFKAFNS